MKVAFNQLFCKCPKDFGECWSMYFTRGGKSYHSMIRIPTTITQVVVYEGGGHCHFLSNSLSESKLESYIMDIYVSRIGGTSGF